jgi:dihydrofolate reductase
MRKLIAGMKISVDGKSEGPDGMADWVSAWSDDYGLMPDIDACVLGGGMYGGYEAYWTAIQNAPGEPLPMTGALAAPAEIEWARFAASVPHYVLSTTLATAEWPLTRFLKSADDVAVLKREKGKDIYLVGGARTTAGLIEAGLVDELRLIVYPLIAGPGKALFAGTERRSGLELRGVERLDGGRVRMVYGIG